MRYSRLAVPLAGALAALLLLVQPSLSQAGVPEDLALLITEVPPEFVPTTEGFNGPMTKEELSEVWPSDGDLATFKRGFARTLINQQRGEQVVFLVVEFTQPIPPRSFLNGFNEGVAESAEFEPYVVPDLSDSGGMRGTQPGDPPSHIKAVALLRGPVAALVMFTGINGFIEDGFVHQISRQQSEKLSVISPYKPPDPAESLGYAMGRLFGSAVILAVIVGVPVALIVRARKKPTAQAPVEAPSGPVSGPGTRSDEGRELRE